MSNTSINPEDLATQSVRLKEEQLRKEEEKLREIELKVQREISEKRQELLAREESLKGESGGTGVVSSELRPQIQFADHRLRSLSPFRQSWSRDYRRRPCRNMPKDASILHAASGNSTGSPKPWKVGWAVRIVAGGGS